MGLALTDSEGKMAFPHEVIPNNGEMIKYLDGLIKTKNITGIVIGHSKNFAGKDNIIQTAIEEFIADLTLHFGLPVHSEMEHFTTQEAIRFQGKTELTDAAAAAIILNSYITKKK